MSQITEEIKSKLNIVDLISGYVTLKKAGRNFKANCPFHNEKTPSFIVSSEKQIWHCFGCNEGGDIFSFVSKIEGLTFPETVEKLANMTNTVLPTKPKKNNNRFNKTVLLKLNEVAAEIYHKVLLETKEGQNAKLYLESRGLSEDIIKKFKIGFSPKNDLFLYNLLSKKGYGPKELEASGLCYLYGSKPKDRFSGRITFPITDISGKIIGFTARVLDNSLPKYVNTPQTVIYNKSQVVYGLSLAKGAIKSQDYVILVEGNMDVVACFNKEVENVVAVSGTAVTSQQLSFIGRFTRNIRIALDFDEAGKKATEKAIELALQDDFNVSVVTLENDKDPADAVNTNKEKFLEAIDSALPAVAYVLTNSLIKNDVKTAYGKKMIASEVTKIINLLPNQVEKRHWLKVLAKQLDVSEKDLMLVEKISHQPKTYFKEISSEEIENILFGLVLNEPKFIAFLVNNLSEDEISLQNKPLYFSFMSFKKRKFTLKSYFQEFPELKDRASRLSLLIEGMYPEITFDKAGDEILFLLRKIRSNQLLIKTQNLLLEIQNAEKEKNLEKKNLLLKEYNNLLLTKESL